MLSGGQPRAATFTVLVQLCGPQAKETEMAGPYSLYVIEVCFTAGVQNSELGHRCQRCAISHEDLHEDI